MMAYDASAQRKADGQAAARGASAATQGSEAGARGLLVSVTDLARFELDKREAEEHLHRASQAGTARREGLHEHGSEKGRGMIAERDLAAG